MKGFFNRILRVNLNQKSYSYEEIPDAVLKETLGGKGLGIYLLSRENKPNVEALSPENCFIVTVGPVTGSKMWGQSRFGAFAKSPATGGFGESYCGGDLAPKIKGCGVDAVIFQGGAADLTFLAIDEKGVKFHDASPVKGKDTVESEEHILKHSPPNASALVIGPAGENLAACACVKANRWRSLGRGGFGAVLGAKNIKGIAFAGAKNCEVADEELIKAVARRVAQTGKGNPVTEVYRKLGTPNQVRVTNQQKCFPTQYWQSGYFDKWRNISSDYMQANFDIEARGCPTCFLKCTKLSKVRQGRHAGLELEGPEFETIYAIGGLNCIDSLEEIAWLNDLCDRMGIDTMTAGNLSAFLVEARKQGKTDFAIDYNQPDRVAELFRLIAYRQGIGDLLAQGIKEAAKILGMEDRAVHVKGLEPGGFDPRVLKGMGLSYATSARGACHLRGTFYKAELSGQMPKEQIEGKAKLHIDYEDRSAIFDSLVLCRFFRDYILWDELLDLVAGTTGMRLTKGQLEDLANGITQNTRAYNHREGLGAATDTLPPALFEANREGACLTRGDLDTMIGEYNQIRKRNL
ncbi:MAG: aldehyde ferredoxin oxidoreductase family protein [Deltaproteobacteria bacterium]|nr:aldehyde ferredoxin oxidoreductase family protein [Deltaproteobacteria bacterium]